MNKVKCDVMDLYYIVRDQFNDDRDLISMEVVGTCFGAHFASKTIAALRNNRKENEWFRGSTDLDELLEES